MDSLNRFLAACRCEPVDRPPIWLMRQAGRYMVEYQKIKEQYSFLEMCQTPELAARITLLPIRQLKVDAAILFSDLLIPLLGIGFDVEYVPDVGPVVTTPEKDYEKIVQFPLPTMASEFSYVGASIKMFREMTAHQVPLIGFTGAPFTLASYIIEGGSSRNFLKTKQLMYQHPHIFSALMDRLSELVILYSQYQIDQGVVALQLFDSWAGCLSPDDYRVHVLPVTRRIVAKLRQNDAPIIYFLKGSAGYLHMVPEIRPDVMSIDTFQSLRRARDILGPEIALQGNLDPMALFLPPEKLEEKVVDMLEEIAPERGYIFNLGHGIVPQTDEKQVAFLVDCVKTEGRKFTLNGRYDNH